VPLLLLLLLLLVLLLLLLLLVLHVGWSAGFAIGAYREVQALKKMQVIDK